MKNGRARKRLRVAGVSLPVAILWVVAITLFPVPAVAEFCDGGFEDGPFSECWDVKCEIVSTPWCNQELCNENVSPRSGEAWHWHGGFTFSEDGCSVKQGPIEFESKFQTTGGRMNAWVDDVSMTDDELTFWLSGEAGGVDTGIQEGWLRVLVDGDEVWRVDYTEINDYRDRYFRISVPLDGCTLAVESRKLSVRPGRKLPVKLTVKHRRPTDTKTAFVLTLRNSKGKAVATETTREYTFRYGSTLRKTARFTVPKHIQPGRYTLEARLVGMQQGEVVSSGFVDVR